MKTIEEAAKDFEKENGEKIWFENDQMGSALCIESFKSGVDFAQRWIPISEEKPEKQGHYFVKVLNSFPKNCDVMVAEFYDDNHVFYCEHSDSSIHDVTHWRPIELK